MPVPSPLRLLLALALLIPALLVPPSAARGDEKFPSRPVEIIVAYPPGGIADTSVRIIQPALARALGTAVAIVNKPGASGAIATEHVRRARPDGYTVLAPTNAPFTTTFVTMKDIGYRLADFTTLGGFASDPTVVVSKSTNPWRTLDELVAHARKHPGTLNYGTGGAAGIGFFAMEMVKEAYGLDMVAVHFQGSGPLKNALLGGHVPLAVGNFLSFAPLIRSGDAIPLVLTSSARHRDAPATPTLQEKGFAGFSIDVSNGLFVPRETPGPVAEVLSRALASALQDPATVAALEKAGLVARYQDGPTYARTLESELARLKTAAERLKLTPR
jgi:tripartite-type tricarboxylate transporter receptor subunit TctC